MPAKPLIALLLLLVVPARGDEDVSEDDPAAKVRAAQIRHLKSEREAMQTAVRHLNAIEQGKPKLSPEAKELLIKRYTERLKAGPQRLLEIRSGKMPPQMPPLPNPVGSVGQFTGDLEFEVWQVEGPEEMLVLGTIPKTETAIFGENIVRTIPKEGRIPIIIYRLLGLPTADLNPGSTLKPDKVFEVTQVEQVELYVPRGQQEYRIAFRVSLKPIDVSKRLTALENPPVKAGDARSVAEWLLNTSIDRRNTRQEVRVGGKAIEVSDILNLAGGDIDLVRISLWGNWFVLDSDLKMLEGLSGLEGISAGSSNLGDAGLEHLKSLDSLESLAVGYTFVTDAGLKHLVGLSKLRMLDLMETRVGDAGMETIGTMTNLTGLNLEGTNITDAGLGRLKSLKNLKSLRVRKTRVTEAGLREFKTAIPDCMIVR